MKAKLAILPGDGIGEEVMHEALRVLAVIEDCFGHQFDCRHGFVGGAAYDKFGCHFPKETEELCRSSQAILFGSVGGPVAEASLPKWQNCEANSILALRKTFSFHANFRPARVYPILADICPLRPSLIESGVDLLIVRELLGDIYFGEHTRGIDNSKRWARDVASYTEEQIENVGRAAFLAAAQRRKRLTSVDKANVLATSRLWREVISELSGEYPDVSLEHMLVDNCAMQLIRNPAQFDVIVTANLFGDILSDAAAVLPGSLGLLPSASLNSSGFGLYEPSGGSAPDIAGQGIANPIAQILSLALMLRHSFALEAEASAIEGAIHSVLTNGLRTRDISNSTTQPVSTSEMGDAIVAALNSGG